MNYFKRLETILIAIIILLLGVAYGFLNDRSSQDENRQALTDQSQSSQEQQLQLVPAGTVAYQGQEGRTAMDILKAKHNVQTQSFGDMGEFVKAIDGIEPDSSHFWAFYLNGQMSQVGADSYVTRPEDTIEWKLEGIE